jgi:hypothetical protein
MELKIKIKSPRNVYTFSSDFTEDEIKALATFALQFLVDSGVVSPNIPEDIRKKIEEDFINDYLAVIPKEVLPEA